MFSPLNIVIQPSRIKRWLHLAVHLLVGLSLFFTSLALMWQFLVIFLLVISACYEFKSQQTIMLYWDINARKMSVAIAGQALVKCLAIKKLNLLFGVLYLQIQRQQQADLHLFIYPDSVDKQSYRRLRVAAKWGNIKLSIDN